MRKRNQGFTLIELMVVMAVVAILATMAVPGLQAFVANNRQAGAVNDLLSSLYFARDEAVTRNTPVTLCPSADGIVCESVGWEAGHIVFVDDDGDGALDGAEETLARSETLPAGLIVQSAEYSDFLTYRPNGRVRASDPNANRGSFSFCAPSSSSQARQAHVGLSGRPFAKRLTGDAAVALCGS